MPDVTPLESLKGLIEKKQATVGIIGLGYVGLPLAHAFIEAGFSALGYDVDQKKIDMLNKCESYIGHIPSAWLKSWRQADRFVASSDPESLAKADAILICVPTPLTESRDPDLSYVVSTVRTITKILRPGQLIVLESTTYPGTTRDVMLPELEKAGLKVGQDFFLAYSPEREDPGNPDFSAAKIPKVVGGFDEPSQEAANALYRAVVTDVVPVSSCEVAEACKILENTYRAVNIALVNELKVLCQRMGIDVWEVIDAAKSKPFGFSAFYPGPGLGGHCIPIDPFYLSWVARKYGMQTRFIELAGEVNSSMPEYVLKRISDALNDCSKPVRGSRISLLGVAYKKDVDDPRESPSFVLLAGLLAQGAEVTYNDPHIPKLPLMRSHDVPSLASCELTPEYLASQDCVLIATDHSSYDYDFIVKHAPLVVDTRNATKNVAQGRDKIVKA
ncbi:MAG: nucleotide sugar dehydrogenase [Planctomycetes bacterium]|nr:nucleotide sugar dehydrogenase [Planctomycetota bacterium]